MKIKTIRRELLLREIQAMPYGQSFTIKGTIASELFPPPLPPTLDEVVRDISNALNAPRGQFASELPPDDSPKSSAEVIARELGEGFSVQTGALGNIEIVRPLHFCPKCHGKGTYVKPVEFDLILADSLQPQTPIDETIEIEWLACDHMPD